MMMRGNAEHPMRVWSHLCLIACVALLAPPHARANDAMLAEALRLTGPAMWLDSGAPGLVVAVVSGPASLIRGYGETTKGNGREPDGTSLLRLGSISKVFTTQLLAGMVVDGSVRLTDTLQQHLPGTTVPRSGARQITLLSLATHSAGLPREIGDPPDGTVAFTWPTRTVRGSWLSTYALPWAPGSVAAYSNVGFDLLADALTSVAGRDYGALLYDRITGPLGMADTSLTPTAEQCGRLMTGSGIAGPAPCVDTTATAGGGGIYSTADDMVRWMRHQLEARDQATDGMLALQHAVYRQRGAMRAAIGFDEAGMMDGLALGWVVMAGHGGMPPIIQKSGGGAGFMSYVAFVPGRRVGVFVAVSRVDFGMFHGLTAAANGLLAMLAPR